MTLCSPLTSSLMSLVGVATGVVGHIPDPSHSLSVCCVVTQDREVTHHQMISYKTPPAPSPRVLTLFTLEHLSPPLSLPPPPCLFQSFRQGQIRHIRYLIQFIVI